MQCHKHKGKERDEDHQFDWVMAIQLAQLLAGVGQVMPERLEAARARLAQVKGFL